MTELFEFIIILFIIVISALIIAFLVERTKALFSILSLRKIDGVAVKIHHPVSLIIPKTLKAPFASIKLRNKTYEVYLYHGGGRTKFVHIASDKYTVVFSKRGGMTPKSAGRGFGTRKRVVINMPTSVSSAKVKLLPTPSCDGVIPILLFCPTPHELTFVTKERTSIKVAFTGDRVGIWQVFTPDTLPRYIDRDSRGFYDNTNPKSDI